MKGYFESRLEEVTYELAGDILDERPDRETIARTLEKFAFVIIAAVKSEASK